LVHTRGQRGIAVEAWQLRLGAEDYLVSFSFESNRYSRQSV
jgi:hypothetical protein